MKPTVALMAMLAGAVSPLAAHAATLTFDTVPSYATYSYDDEGNRVAPVYEESGFAVTPQRYYYFGGSQNLHFDFAGEGDWQEAVSIHSVEGLLFGLDSFDIRSSVYDVEAPGDNLLIEGFLGGSLVQSITATFLNGSNFFQTEGFFGFDQIVIRENPDCGCPLIPIDGYEYPDYHFDLDNLTLSTTPADVQNETPNAVPLPATGVLLLSALVALRRRRGKA